MPDFKIHSPYQMAGDQPEAVAKLVEGINNGLTEQTLMGVTGSGKTFTMANIIEQTQRPTLVLAHNKTLAAQLCTELREFFPENAVEYFVSYYDYYQPEAYIASTDTYIEKDSAINDEIDRLRHSATSALSERRDVIIVSSVSCIYSLGDPIDYKRMVISIRPGMEMSREELIRRLIDIQYERNDIAFERNRFRVRGDTVEIWPVYSDEDVVRIEFFGDEVDRISRINPLTGVSLGELGHIAVFPASHYVTPKEKLEEAIKDLEEELEQRVKYFEENGKLIEAQRIAQRTRYDIEMLQEIGFCSGVENYSRVLSRREPGSAPYTLIDYFPKDFLCIIDESHVTVPQIRGMHEGDRSRKVTLAEHGFRLPSCLDNRPLRFDEFEERIPQFVYVSATPGDYEQKVSQQQVEQIIRPTGLLDPEIIVRGSASQIDDIIDEAKERADRNERVLITTLTKKMAEDLTDHLLDRGLRARYMHSDIGTLERVDILRDLRLGKFDVLVGINLLREGLDLPEVTLVAILDADKEGFLRNQRSLIQTIGRAARNANGQVIMYADKTTDSMDLAISETRRRRSIQMAYNEEHGITPKTVTKAVVDIMSYVHGEMGDVSSEQVNMQLAELSREEVLRVISSMEEDMAEASRNMDFEEALARRGGAPACRRGGRKRGGCAQGPEEERAQRQRLRQSQERSVRQLASVVEPCCPSTAG